MSANSRPLTKPQKMRQHREKQMARQKRQSLLDKLFADPNPMGVSQSQSTESKPALGSEDSTLEGTRQEVAEKGAKGPVGTAEDTAAAAHVFKEQSAFEALTDVLAKSTR